VSAPTKPPPQGDEVYHAREERAGYGAWEEHGEGYGKLIFREVLVGGVFAEGEYLRRESICGGRVFAGGECLRGESCFGGRVFVGGVCFGGECLRGECFRGGGESVSGRLCVKRLTCYVFSFKREALATVALTNEK
jgi:hypothetical protein